MFFLKYLEDSDAGCKMSVSLHSRFKDCSRQMQEEFENVREHLGICKAALPDPNEDDGTGPFSGELDIWNAYLRDGMDTYCWTIIEEPRFVSSENLFVVHGISHDLKNGNIVFCSPSIYCNKAAAQKQLRTLFDEKLKEYGLEENGACNNKGESIPGGCFSDDEAVIYNCAPYAHDCLIEVASYVISPVNSVDTTMEKEPGVLGRFVSVWDGGLEVSSPCRIDFESGMVTITGPNDCPNESCLEHLEKEYVEANGQTYCVVELELYQNLVENGDINSDGIGAHGKPVLWY